MIGSWKKPEIQVISLEWLVGAISGSPRTSKLDSVRRVILALSCVWIIGFLAAAMIQDKWWVLVTYGLLVVTYAIDALLSLAGVIRALDNPAKYMARSMSGLFVREQEALRDLALSPASHLELLRARVLLQIELIEGRLLAMPALIGIGGLVGPLLGFVAVQQTSEHASRAAALGAAFSFGIFSGSLALRAALNTWKRARFVLEQALKACAK